MKFISDKPIGSIYRFDTPEDLKKFISLIGVKSEELHRYDMEFQAIEGKEYDDYIDGFSMSCGEDSSEYSSEELVQVPKEQEVFITVIHDTNEYFDEQYGYSTVESGILEPEEIKLGEYWDDKFPCVAYINIQSDFDRMGNVEINVFHVQKLDQIPTAESLSAFIADNASKQLELYEYYCGLEDYMYYSNEGREY